jgi:hypothetical protein
MQLKGGNSIWRSLEQFAQRGSEVGLPVRFAQDLERRQPWAIIDHHIFGIS